jgi:hypothetical protein
VGWSQGISPGAMSCPRIAPAVAFRASHDARHALGVGAEALVLT